MAKNCNFLKVQQFQKSKQSWNHLCQPQIHFTANANLMMMMLLIPIPLPKFLRRDSAACLLVDSFPVQEFEFEEWFQKQPEVFCWKVRLLINFQRQSKDIVIVKREYDCITKKPFSFEIRICSFPSSFVCLLEIVNCFLKWISEIGKWRKFSSCAAPHQIKSYCSKREREGKIFRR